MEQQEKDIIIKKFSQIKKRQLIMVVPVLLALLLLFVQSGNPDYALLGVSGSLLGILALAVIFGVLVFSFINWRCPSCRAYLGKGLGPKFCPKCGVKFI